MKHTGQESESQLCEIIIFWSILQSKSVNNVCKLLQLLEDFVPQTPYRGFAPEPHGGISIPQMKNPDTATANNTE